MYDHIASVCKTVSRHGHGFSQMLAYDFWHAFRPAHYYLGQPKTIGIRVVRLSAPSYNTIDLAYDKQRRALVARTDRLTRRACSVGSGYSTFRPSFRVLLCITVIRRSTAHWMLKRLNFPPAQSLLKSLLCPETRSFLGGRPSSFEDP